MGDLQVQVLIGSGSDAGVMASTVRTLRDLKITCDMTVASAHRSPDRVRRVMEAALGRGVQVFVVGAGAAAHLAGVVAALFGARFPAGRDQDRRYPVFRHPCTAWRV